jgi:chorismate mutase/prephenate dehydratase
MTLMRDSLEVGYFGREGTFSHYVALRRFGQQALLRPYPFMADMVADVASGIVQAAVIPIENSVGGWVADIIDLLLSESFRGARLQIVEEMRVPIQLSLIGHCGLERAKRVYSHRFPLRVAREWLRRERPDLEFVEVHDTAESAARVDEDREGVALAHVRAAVLRQVPIIMRSIPIELKNATRFFVVGRGPIGSDLGSQLVARVRTALCFALVDRPGALHQLLGILADEGLNLCRLHSHARDHLLDKYYFFVEVEESLVTSAMQRALERMKPLTVELDVLGSFPVIELSGASESRLEDCSGGHD